MEIAWNFSDEKRNCYKSSLESFSPLSNDRGTKHRLSFYFFVCHLYLYFSVSATEEIGTFESSPLLTDMLTNMNISSAPDSQFVAMGREAEDMFSDAGGQNASGPANEVEHESSQCQNYNNQSIGFPGINENPSGNSRDW